jgi:hypothetical protein
LARRFAAYEPAPDRLKGARALRDIASAIKRRASAERTSQPFTVTRAEGHSWAAIGAMRGTSGGTARQRYGTPPAKAAATAAHDAVAAGQPTATI